LIEIEKSKDLKKLIMKELMGSLQAYDQKIKKKSGKEIIIRTSFTNKIDYEK
jgi:hypothetical protein